ncbi:outer membrane protein [Lentibacter sp. XHP0401]|uniref:outer membrane protein n=1 Tax=Lentibacter sp. XHP0401 TaxID=2984334 RepID=UPI0021E6F970|nr:porin family protein [Lentibacter sp. XHP0401]MCV2893702.1 porin family protein [Lentibacter sp. XHP0401]
MRYKIPALAAATAMAATPLLAGNLEPVTPEPMIQPVAVPVQASADWTGWYAGGQVGYADVDATGGLNGDGAIGGFVAGYDYDFGTWVLGGGIDYDISDIDVGGATSLENVARLKMRGGYKLGDGLAYATLGAAHADTDTLGSDTGYFVGAGYEHMISENFSLGGEVLYHQFDDFDGSGIDVDATTLQLRATYRF